MDERATAPSCVQCNPTIFSEPQNHDGRRPVASITIRNLDDEVKTRLRVRAAEHHRSVEE